jgi:magnesium transporter
MITIFKNNPNGLQVIPELVDGAWVHVIDPSPEEMTWLQKLDIPNDFFIYSLDVDERSRVERENGEVFILLRMPTFQGASADIPYSTVPLGIILTPKYFDHGQQV